MFLHRVKMNWKKHQTLTFDDTIRSMPLGVDESNCGAKAEAEEHLNLFNNNARFVFLASSTGPDSSNPEQAAEQAGTRSRWSLLPAHPLQRQPKSWRFLAQVNELRGIEWN